MKNQLRLAYDLLTDLPLLKNQGVITCAEMEYLSTPNLSHRYSKTLIGRYYLRHYYARMIATAFNQFDKEYFLELGCGSGTQVIFAHKVGFKLATGIDTSPERIAIAQKRAQFYKATGSMFSVTDFWKFCPANRYSAVYSMFAFELFGSPPSMAAEHLSRFCSKRCTIILDMGHVSRLQKQNYFTDLVSSLNKLGFSVRLETLIPFLVGTGMIRWLGQLSLWPFSRPIRLIAERK